MKKNELKFVIQQKQVKAKFPAESRYTMTPVKNFPVVFKNIRFFESF